MASDREEIDGIGIPPMAPDMSTGRIGSGAGTGSAPTAPAADSFDGRTKAPDFLTVARKATVATAMSSEGSEYVRKLKEYLRDKNSLNQPVEIRTLPYPSETQVITVGDQAIVLLFSEALHKQDNLPVIADAKQALLTMRSTLGDHIKMRSCMVVTPHDYKRAEIMGACLLNTFASQLNPEVQALNLNSLDNHYLEVSLNPQEHDEYVNRYDPHGIHAPDNLGIVVKLAKNHQRGSQDFFSAAEQDSMAIGAISAYVNFIKTPVPGGMYKFIPEVHISNLVTPMPFDGMIALLLSVAVDILMDNGYWKTQFNEFGGANVPNIGNLVTNNETGAPFKVENASQKEWIFGSCLENPILVLDVINGRYCIPGLERFALAGDHPLIIESFNKFLCATAGGIPTTVSPGSLMAREYTGTIGRSGGVPSDSRWANFLNTMIHYSTDPMVHRLLEHPTDPVDGVNLVRNFYKDLSLLYVNDMVLLNAAVMRELQKLVHQKIRIINGTNNQSIMDTSMLLQAGQGFASTQAQNFYQMQGTPFNQLYGSTGIQRNLFM